MYFLPFTYTGAGGALLLTAVIAHSVHTDHQRTLEPVLFSRLFYRYTHLFVQLKGDIEKG